jgi:nickel transport protein
MWSFSSESNTRPKRLRIAGLFLLGAAAFAHDLEVQVQLSPPAVIARATYAGTQQASFVKVTVHSPGATTPYQSGNADMHGAFSFVPDSPGAWRLIVDDELGHLKEVTVVVPAPFTSRAAAPSSGTSRLERAIIGVALIAGAAGIWYGYRSRRYQPKI